MDTNSLFSLAWTQLWQVSLLVIFVLAINRCLANRRPQLAHLLWLVVLLKCLTPPIVATPWSLFGWADHQWPDQTAGAVVVQASDGFWPAELATEPSIINPIVQDTASAPMMATEIGSTVQTQSAISMTAVALYIWVIGALSVFVVFALRCLRQLRRVLMQQADSDEGIDRAVATLAKRMGLKRSVSVVLTHSNIGPAVVGFFRPKLILPVQLVAGRKREELQPILAHELVHIRRGDLWLGAVQWIVQAVWWFHPLVWFGNRLMNRDAERCCDEEVIAELEYSPAHYARTLLDVLSMKQELNPMPLFPGVRPVDVTSQRLERIMSLGQGSLRRTPRLYVLLAAALAVVVLPGAWMQTQAQETVLPGKPRQISIHDTQERQQKIEWKQTQLTFENEAGEEFTVDGAAVAEAQAKLLQQTMTVKVYSIPKELTQAERENVSPAAIVTLLKSGDQGAADLLALKASNESTKQQMGPTYVLEKSSQSIIVRHTAAGHDRVANTLSAIARYGFRQLQIQVRVIEVPTQMVHNLGLDWQLVEMPHEQVVTASAEFDSSDFAPDKTVTAAAYTVEKRMPALYATLNPEHTKSMLGVVKSDGEGKVLASLKVAIFNGQRAHIANAVQRPFVVGLQKSKEGHQPQIRVVEDGWRMAIRGVLKEDAIWLQCDAKLSTQRSVETRVLPIKIDGKQVALQIPEVARSRINVGAVVDNKDSLVVYGLQSDTKADSTLLVMLTPSLTDERHERQPDQSKEMLTYQRHPLDGGVAASQKETREPPTDAQVISLLEKEINAKTKHQGTKWNHLRIVKEKVADYVDKPRVYPMVGPAQMHHAHYKCTVYYELKKRSKVTTRQADDDVASDEIYIDVTHLIPVDQKKRPKPRVRKPTASHGTALPVGKAPIAVDFAFPSAKANRVFSFFIGLAR